MSRRKASRLRIVVTGLIAQHPTLGGVAWDYLQYVLGLHRLGHDVYYLEDSGQWPYRLDGGPTADDWVARDCRANIEHLDRVMRRWSLQDRWAYFCPVEQRWYGLCPRKRRDVLGSADLLLNVSGSLRRPGRYRRIGCLVYIDSDPVFTQVKLNLVRGQERFRGRASVHDVFFTFGECLGPQIPATEYRWLPTRQPIVLDQWEPRSEYRPVFTTIMSWASYPPLRYAGRIYGQKDVEFGRFLDLPTHVGEGLLEVALGATRHPNWEGSARAWPERVRRLVEGRPGWTPHDLLRACGWRVLDAATVGRDIDSYRRYIESSMGEWSVAKSGYVVAHCGWFSCRSACYLAAGKPVVVQDTGFSTTIPTGEGVLPFRSTEEATAAVEAVRGHYGKHAAAARAIAVEYFDAGKVLPALIEAALGKPAAGGGSASRRALP